MHACKLHARASRSRASHSWTWREGVVLRRARTRDNVLDVPEVFGVHGCVLRVVVGMRIPVSTMAAG